MQYTINRTEKGQTEIKVTVPKAGFDEAYKQTLEKFSNEIVISGFRKGKAPQKLVEEQVGSTKLLNETASALISRHLGEIFVKEKMVPVDSPRIAVSTLSLGSPLVFTVNFVQKPRVKVGAWKKIKLAKIKASEITQKDIDESIKNIYEAWKKKSQSQSGESQSPSEESEEKEEGSKKFIYDAQGNKVFFEDKKEPGSQRDEEPKEGKINDEFAKSVGAQNLAHLKELVKKDLENLVADQVEVKFEGEIFEKLVEISTLDLPDLLVEDELNRMIINLSSSLERQGKELKDFFEEKKTTLEELKKEWRQQAEKNVKIALILEQIGKDEKVTVSDEELEATLKNINQATLSDDQKRDLRNYLSFNIFQSKTLGIVKKAVASHK